MRYIIVDCGPIGLELARRWVRDGHQVVGTTPDPERLSELATVCSEAVELPHEDADRVRDVVREANGAVLATRPRLHTGSQQERVRAYRRSMISVVRAAASVQRRLVLFSSIAVYGDGESPATEETPVTTALDPEAQIFAAVERMALESPLGAVLRLPEVVVDSDQAALQRELKEEFGDVLPYLIDYRDVAAAVEFVVARELAGIFNVVPDQAVPPPGRLVSSAKLREAGFQFSH